jgi:hypothetical protein
MSSKYQSSEKEDRDNYLLFLAGLNKSVQEADCDQWRVGINPFTGKLYTTSKNSQRAFSRMRGKCDPCFDFEYNRKINPRTGRRISPRGKVYKQLVAECNPRSRCKSPINPRSRPRSRSRSRSRPRSRLHSRSRSKSPRKYKASPVRRRRSRSRCRN